MTDIADYLMKQATKADDTAEELLRQADTIAQDPEMLFVGWKSDQLRHDHRDILDRVAFYRGQASGFRQATFVVLQYVGTKTHD